MEYLVIYEKAEDGTVWAQIPDLPGCFSSGFTLIEAKQNVRDAIELHLEGLHEEGFATPIPSVSFELVEV
ncbi:MAG: type II toxin-antitoxin system HicB family antitoxin [Chitinophagaceae bacterium]